MLRFSFLAMALCCSNWHDAPDPAASVVRPGMTAREARQLLGSPICTTRQLLYRRHIEQWVYENPQQIRLQVNCVRGEEPVVTAVLRSRSLVTTGK